MAAAPVTMGAAMEVPDMKAKDLSGMVLRMNVPGAAISTLTGP